MSGEPATYSNGKGLQIQVLEAQQEVLRAERRRDALQWEIALGKAEREIKTLRSLLDRYETYVERLIEAASGRDDVPDLLEEIIRQVAIQHSEIRHARDQMKTNE